VVRRPDSVVDQVNCPALLVQNASYVLYVMYVVELFGVNWILMLSSVVAFAQNAALLLMRWRKINVRSDKSRKRVVSEKMDPIAVVVEPAAPGAPAAQVEPKSASAVLVEKTVAELVAKLGDWAKAGNYEMSIQDWPHCMAQAVSFVMAMKKLNGDEKNQVVLDCLLQYVEQLSSLDAQSRSLIKVGIELSGPAIIDRLLGAHNGELKPVTACACSIM
jgi:hypothetical protein